MSTAGAAVTPADARAPTAQSDTSARSGANQQEAELEPISEPAKKRSRPVQHQVAFAADTAEADEKRRIYEAENGLEPEPDADLYFDPSAPQPSSDNVVMPATGDFADQIDQEAIFEQAEADGLLDMTGRYSDPE